MLITFIYSITLVILGFAAGLIFTKIREPLVGTIILDIDRSLICYFKDMTDYDKILTHRYVRFKMVARKGEPK